MTHIRKTARRLAAVTSDAARYSVGEPGSSRSAGIPLLIDDRRVEALFAAASQARSNAHAPYSGFAVGAAALGAGGGVFAGCNVENAAYPVGSCAEAGALSAMVATGERRLEAILVLGGSEALCAPCGACRQRIREFGEASTPVFVAGPGGVRRQFTLGELLPESFGPETLGKDALG